MWTVLVTWTDAPKRSERLNAARGTTTTRRMHATAFPTREEAERVGGVCLTGIGGVLRWRVAPF